MKYYEKLQNSSCKKIRNSKNNDDVSPNLPMTYFRCPECSNSKLEYCDCSISNYKCNKCNWKYITHNHLSKSVQNNIISNDINYNSILLKTIRK
jgi:rubredoxin